MSGLAKYILSCDKKVGGSDNFANAYTEELVRLGAKVEIADDKSNLKKYDVVVCTDAVREDDFHITEARKLNKTILSRGQFLYEISRDFDKVIAVSGCHGKTTCTAMLAHIFKSAGVGFGAHIGGKDSELSNGYFCGRDYFITEACEYKKNFLLLKPDIAVVLNSDPDHLECYGSAENLLAAYRRFAGSAEISVTLYGDKISGSLNFGMHKKADFSAREITCKEGLYSFAAYDGGTRLGVISLNVYGKHNVLNALAAVAAARCAGIDFDKISEGLSSFGGVERRFEYIGHVKGARCVADYAHHPDEIKATLSVIKKLAENKLYVVFQPHTYSRTKNLFKEFIKVLSPIGNLLIYRTFAAREYFDDEGSALTLSQHVKKSKYGDCVQDIEDFLKDATAGDYVLFLGAGDIYDIAKTVTEK